MTTWACRLCTAAGRESGRRVRGNGRITICADCKTLWASRGKKWCNRGEHLVPCTAWSTQNCCKECRNAALRANEYGHRLRAPLEKRRAYEAAWHARNPGYYQRRYHRRKLAVWKGER